MGFTIYDVAVPALTQILGSIAKILDKAAGHCEDKKIDAAVLVNYRLAADMFPLSRQVQIMTDQAKGLMARLAGAEIPVYQDVEVTLPELQARIAKTLNFIKSFTPDQLAGAEDKAITLKVGGKDVTMKGSQYLVNHGLPNFYFHAATTYDILRHAGVSLGKRDFLGAA